MGLSALPSTGCKVSYIFLPGSPEAFLGAFVTSGSTEALLGQAINGQAWASGLPEAGAGLGAVPGWPSRGVLAQGILQGGTGRPHQLR